MIEIYLKEGKVSEIEKLLSEGMVIVESLDNPEIKIDMQIMKSKVLSLTSKENVDLEDSLTCLRLAHEIEKKDLISMSYLEIGKIYLRQENYLEALQAYKKGLKLAEIVQNQWLIAQFLVEIGDTLIQNKKMASAEETLLDAFSISNKLQAKELIARTKFGLAKILLNKNREKKAQALFIESLNIYNELGHIDAKLVQTWLKSII